MKRNEFIKKAIDENIADKENILYNTLNSISNEHIIKNQKINYKKVVFRVATSFAVISAIVWGSIFVNLPQRNQILAPQGENSTQQNAISQQPQKNMFTLVAYATENSNSKNSSNGSSIKQETKTVLNPNVRVQIPFGKIQRGKYNTFLYENGKRYEGYEVNFGGGLVFVCNGENIESVTYTSLTGKLRYFDVDLLKEMEAKGDLRICKIPVSGSKLNPEGSFENVKKVFYQMWSNGELDEYKNKYFAGKNIDLDDYSIGFSGTSGNWFLVISNKENESYPYKEGPYKEGPTVVAKSGRSVDWEPTKAIDMVMAYAPLNNEELPGDTVTVTAKFTDGQKLTQTISLSFDKEGNIIAEVKVN